MVYGLPPHTIMHVGESTHTHAHARAQRERFLSVFWKIHLKTALTSLLVNPLPAA